MIPMLAFEPTCVDSGMNYLTSINIEQQTKQAYTKDNLID